MQLHGGLIYTLWRGWFSLETPLPWHATIFLGQAQFCTEDIIISFHPLLKVHTHVILKYALVFYGIHSMTSFYEYVSAICVYTDLPTAFQPIKKDRPPNARSIHIF